MGKEPIEGKGNKAFFYKTGYGVNLVEGFHTSCRGNACALVWKTFLECENPIPVKKTLESYIMDSSIERLAPSSGTGTLSQF